MRSVSETAAAACIVVLSTLVILVVLGNILVCVIIMKHRDMQNALNFLLVNLAISDIVIAIFIIPDFILSRTFSHPDGATGSVLCRLLTGGNFSWVGAASSVFTLMVISIERYHAVLHPYGNRWKLSYHNLKVIIPSCWIFAVIMILPTFLSVDFDNTIRDCEEYWPSKWMGIAYSITLFLILAALPLVFMTGLYSRVVYALWFRKNDHTQLSHQQQGVMKVRRRVTLTVTIVSASFGICWITDSTIFFLHHVTSPYSDVSFAIGAIMILSNSALNPFVYALTNKRFNQKIKAMLHRNVFQRNKVHPGEEHLSCNELTKEHKTIAAFLQISH